MHRSFPSSPIRMLFAIVAGLLFALPLLAQRPAPSPPSTWEARWQAWESRRLMEAESPYRGLAWRAVGPTVQGGRVVDVEPIPGNDQGFYVAVASGGVWKTTNMGGSWEPLFDHQATIITGDLAVDPSHPERVWLGTGEPNSSRSSYGGMGV